MIRVGRGEAGGGGGAERLREAMGCEIVRACVFTFAHACLRACVRVCVCSRACVHVHVLVCVFTWACVDTGESERFSEILNVLLN